MRPFLQIFQPDGVWAAGRERKLCSCAEDEGMTTRVHLNTGTGRLVSGGEQFCALNRTIAWIEQNNAGTSRPRPYPVTVFRCALETRANMPALARVRFFSYLMGKHERETLLRSGGVAAFSSDWFSMPGGIATGRFSCS